jgi:hypothetical protein
MTAVLRAIRHAAPPFGENTTHDMQVRIGSVRESTVLPGTPAAISCRTLPRPTLGRPGS